jgi:hypothetical protein
MTGKLKLLFLIPLLVALSAGMYFSMDIKNCSINELYEDVTFMRVTIEARQYINQIEYGIKNGRQLDNFFNMQDTLKGIQGCSSYMEGAYIVSASGKLLYQSGLKADSISLTVPKKDMYPKGKTYTAYDDGKYYYLTVPIRNGDGSMEGYLLMCIGKMAVSNAVSDYNRQDFIQSLIIALEILGISIFIARRMKPDKKGRIFLRLVLVISIALISSAAIDSGMVIAKYYRIVDDTTRQSANKMAQALQSDVDSVIAKGIAPERIYDLNGWLAKNSSELPIVTSLTLDKNRKITANVSQNYINSFFNRFIFRITVFMLVCIACGVAACAFVIKLGKVAVMLKVKEPGTEGVVNA